MPTVLTSTTESPRFPFQLGRDSIAEFGSRQAVVLLSRALRAKKIPFGVLLFLRSTDNNNCADQTTWIPPPSVPCTPVVAHDAACSELLLLFRIIARLVPVTTTNHISAGAKVINLNLLLDNGSISEF